MTSPRPRPVRMSLPAVLRNGSTAGGFADERESAAKAAATERTSSIAATVGENDRGNVMRVYLSRVSLVAVSLPGVPSVARLFPGLSLSLL